MEDYTLLLAIFILSFVGLTTYGIQTFAKTSLLVTTQRCMSDSYVGTVHSLSAIGTSMVQTYQREVESRRVAREQDRLQTDDVSDQKAGKRQ